VEAQDLITLVGAIPGGWTGAGCDYTGGWGVGFSC